MVLLENDAFLTDLNKLFLRKKEKGSVWVTFKSYSEEDKRGKKRRVEEGADKSVAAPSCLLRATDGDKIKISTIVKSKDLPRFQQAYSNILLVNMDSLKKKAKKKKAKKAKA
eukprot:TRINITY_DN5475_c0_g1_i2.p1 TRINITY_DN5475_c0_g1~~TRINITY_DN5475_c0_g1_i2.p1  ORF type:complete len:112 (+),score=32.64 TRINITY_DN5475_c0_g1_i2:51-386(+)